MEAQEEHRDLPLCQMTWGWNRDTQKFLLLLNKVEFFFFFFQMLVYLQYWACVSAMGRKKTQHMLNRHQVVYISKHCINLKIAMKFLWKLWFPRPTVPACLLVDDKADHCSSFATVRCWLNWEKLIWIQVVAESFPHPSLHFPLLPPGWTTASDSPTTSISCCSWRTRCSTASS